MIFLPLLLVYPLLGLFAYARTDADRFMVLALVAAYVAGYLKFAGWLRRWAKRS